MINLIFLLEEQSAKYLLERLLEKILPPHVSYKCISHRGNRHLRKSINIKLKKWIEPNTFFVIMHDQNSHHNCIALKKELQSLCEDTDHTPLIRIICQELEAWYFGDLHAVQKAYPEFNASQYIGKRKYRVPDNIVQPSKKIKEILSRKGIDVSKTTMAMEISKHMDINNNTSRSFKNMVTGIRKLAHSKLRAPQN